MNDKWKYIKVPYDFLSVKVPVDSDQRYWEDVVILDIELHSLPGINLGINEEHKIIVYAIRDEA